MCRLLFSTSDSQSLPIPLKDPLTPDVGATRYGFLILSTGIVGSCSHVHSSHLPSAFSTGNRCQLDMKCINLFTEHRHTTDPTSLGSVSQSSMVKSLSRLINGVTQADTDDRWSTYSSINNVTSYGICAYPSADRPLQISILAHAPK